MNKITLLGTTHREIGNCTIINLCKIIENINPNLIFEETNPDEYKLIYEIAPVLGHKSEVLEHSTIQKYTETHNVDHIPIDSLKPPENFNKWSYELTHTYSPEEKFIEYYDLCKYINNYYSENGLENINSTFFDNLLIKKCQLFKDCIYNYRKNSINDYNEFMKYLFEDREYEMINNIIKYFKNNNGVYNAVFLIGADHRISIIKKLEIMDQIEFNFYYKSKPNGT
jgi:hypothetical protein